MMISVIAILLLALILLYKFHTSMKPKWQLPEENEFPAGTQFMIKEFDVPLAMTPQNGQCVWMNWYGGKPRIYDEKNLKLDNHWPAESFEVWIALIKDSMRG